MKHILNRQSLFFLANIAGMMISCAGLKEPEIAGDVSILNVGSTPDTTAVYLTARTDNTDAVSCCGFLWGKERLENRVEAELLQDGSFSSTISGLEPGTSFVFCAFIGNGIDEQCSEILFFKTITRKDAEPDEPGTSKDEPDQPDQPAVIPDQNFKSILLQKFDLDSDGELSDSEISSVQDLYITDDSIESVEGIEYFKGLVRLYINGEDDGFGYYPSGSLTSVDISKNQRLLEFGISHEKVTSVDISENHELIYLQLFSCPISSINLAGADNLVLFGAGFCKFSKLTIKDLKMLEEVHLDHNVLTELILENLPELRYLDCSANQLKTLDLSGCPKIENVDCSENPSLETVYLKKGQELKNITRDEGLKIVYLN